MSLIIIIIIIILTIIIIPEGKCFVAKVSEVCTVGKARANLVLDLDSVK